MTQKKLTTSSKPNFSAVEVFRGFNRLSFPQGTLGFELDWYQKYLQASTGQNFTMEQLNQIGDRILNLIRAFWVREYRSKWNRDLDVPPMRWFKEPLTDGPIERCSCLN